MLSCEDCGTRLSGGICPNCKEELYVFENQWQEDPFELSDDFLKKVEEQR